MKEKTLPKGLCQTIPNRVQNEGNRGPDHDGYPSLKAPAPRDGLFTLRGLFKWICVAILDRTGFCRVVKAVVFEQNQHKM